MSSSSPSASSSPTSSSLSTTDAEILNYALTLEHLEVAFYSQGLTNFSEDAFAQAGFAAAVRANYEEILEHEETHIEFLDAVLTSAGAQTVEACVYDFGSVDVESFIAMSAALETVGASAYSGASGLFSDSDLVPSAASILSTEARQSTWIQNTVQKLNPWSGAFEVPLSPNQVFTIASNFIVSCPSSNPPIIATAPFPQLTIPATAAPGQQVQLSFSTQSSYSPSDLAVAFLTSNGTVFAEFSGSSYTMTFPTTEQLLGTVFVLIVNSTSESVTDATTVAGPTPLMFPFNATDPAVEALFPDISGNSSASSSGISSGSSSSLSTNDAEILNYALTLEHLEVAFYSQGLANFSADAFTKAGFAAAVRANYEEILGHETTHVETLDGVLTSAGAQTVESCVYDL
ncbi:ferritin-like domain-containing protein [Rhodocollybia butyracea]|uniref:Ferritin-like domain-containing protein n=1 Tax=Rhodocollybia butyracea TaxID=206335 RepID=A0A9P5PL08_9AGAR|nr:ferritin-like domain-containing protein [Rhodocollybia butyracea]